jgi:peptidoglycan/xylan/chitin deacetylase (PgdA/CDA1 family)
MKLFRTPRFFRWIFPNKTWGFSSTENSVYLTFDDGPDPEITPWVLDYLSEAGVTATFFCVGENVKQYPEIYARVIAEGHSVGNHSMEHIKGIKVPLKKYVNSVERAAEWIDSDLFRPPYGRISLRQTYQLKKKYKIIMWSWLSYDFDPEVPVDVILSKGKKGIGSSDIIVVHDNRKTADRLKLLLPQLIEIIRSKGLNFLPIPHNQLKIDN